MITPKWSFLFLLLILYLQDYWLSILYKGIHISNICVSREINLEIIYSYDLKRQFIILYLCNLWSERLRWTNNTGKVSVFVTRYSSSGSRTENEGPPVVNVFKWNKTWPSSHTKLLGNANHIEWQGMHWIQKLIWYRAYNWQKSLA